MKGKCDMIKKSGERCENKAKYKYKGLKLCDYHYLILKNLEKVSK